MMRILVQFFLGPNLVIERVMTPEQFALLREGLVLGLYSGADKTTIQFKIGRVSLVLDIGTSREKSNGDSAYATGAAVDLISL